MNMEDLLESSYWYFDQSRREVGERLAFKSQLRVVLDKYERQIKDLKKSLEIERIRLAACGVVALSNTPESAAKARSIAPEYDSASCQDVARMVDENMKLRAAKVKAVNALIKHVENSESRSNAVAIWDIAMDLNKAMKEGLPSEN